MWDRLKPALFKPGIPLPIQRTTSTIGIGMTERVEDSSPYPTWSEEQHKAAIVILKGRNGLRAGRLKNPLLEKNCTKKLPG
jgi:hypothetical protein